MYLLPRIPTKPLNGRSVRAAIESGSELWDEEAKSFGTVDSAEKIWEWLQGPVVELVHRNTNNRCAQCGITSFGIDLYIVISSRERLSGIFRYPDVVIQGSYKPCVGSHLQHIGLRSVGENGEELVSPERMVFMKNAHNRDFSLPKYP